MNYLRIFMLILCMAVSISCLYGIGAILRPILSEQQLASVTTMIILFWFSVEFGVFAGHSLWHEYKSKKIQKELDMERAFRTMGDGK